MASVKDWQAAPCPSARPDPGGNRRGRRKSWSSGAFQRDRVRPGSAPRRHGNAVAEVGDQVGSEGRVGANHLAVMSPRRRFVSFFVGLSALLVVVERCPISLPYQAFRRECASFFWGNRVGDRADLYSPTAGRQSLTDFTVRQLDGSIVSCVALLSEPQTQLGTPTGIYSIPTSPR
jgi:hypothetical protein